MGIVATPMRLRPQIRIRGPIVKATIMSKTTSGAADANVI
jgi:hypothetical protein